MSPGDESATTFVCVCVFPCSETIISDEFEWVRESVFFSFLFPFLSVSFRFCFNKVECEKKKMVRNCLLLALSSFTSISIARATGLESLRAASSGQLVQTKVR